MGWAGAEGEGASRGGNYAPWDGIAPTATTLYEDTGIGPQEINQWFVYDGYSYLAFMLLEALGLVDPGEAGPYIEGGTNIRYNGEHPMNTHGGNLSEGRAHGAGQIMEAVRQIRGEAGARQAKGNDYIILSSAFPYQTAAAAGSSARATRRGVRANAPATASGTEHTTRTAS